ncbi:hypothetical protein [Lacisediminihabitans changchengi]|uniref:Uncharacterized protein n=1 Tax=Lacisediminihabitans changchengi TaxID=2787634 RepID=A0A934SRJ9_9MICO|nr:hypothetical protein [Lacisediminihabitans changchengi]MBK4347723.1 hypothetical protein [Lacisediminihabitans changchengi]
MSAATTSEQRLDAKTIGPVLDAAVVQVLERFGEDRGLSPLRWSVIDYPEGLVIEGRPEAAGPDVAETCAQWAAALTMVEYEWDSVDGERSWHLDIGAWHLELIAGHDTSVDPRELFD